MKQSYRLFLCAAMLLLLASGAFGAEPTFKVSKSSITFGGSPTDAMLAQAVKDFVDAGGDVAKARLILKETDDAGLAKVAKAFPGIKDMLVDKSEITTLAPLVELKDLTKLELNRLPQLKDVSPLAELSKLEKLEVSDSPYTQTDLKWLATMADLKELALDPLPEGITTLEGIEGKAKLAKVKLKGALPDLTPLTTLEQLNHLDLAYSNGDLSPLKGCKKLSRLSLYAAKFKDLSPLAEVASLKNLSVYAMKEVQDFSALGAIKSLEEVQAGLTPMTSVAWVAELPKLKKVSFFTESLADLSPIGKAQSLEELSFWQMRLPDLAFLTSMPNLKRLKLDTINVKEAPIDLTPLGKMSKLEWLYLSQANVAKFETLAASASLKDLFVLKVKDMGVTDISVLKDMPSLKNVEVEKGFFPEEQIKALTDAGKKVKN